MLYMVWFGSINKSLGRIEIVKRHCVMDRGLIQAPLFD
jgi:hypothetical protein